MKEAKAMKQQNPVSRPQESGAYQSPTLTLEDLQVLRAPFSKDSLGIKVQSLNKDRTRAMLVLYLQHTDVQNRLEQVDPAWTCEVLTEERQGDTVYVRMRMIVKGVARENVGDGGDPKSAYSDALKRCAMLFGVGRYLYDASTVWTEYNESRDRFKNWTIADYERANRSGNAVPTQESVAADEEVQPTLASAAPQASGASSKPGLKTSKKNGGGSTKSRDQLNRVLMGLYRPYLTKFPDTRFVELLQSRYQAGETRLLTLEQMEDLISFMEERLKSVA